MYYYSRTYASPIGELTLAAREGALAGLWIEGQKHFSAGLELRAGEDPALDLACAWLDRYFAGERPGIAAVPLAPVGTEFQRAVWGLLREIPYGELTTYGELARRLGRGGARAVGAAVGRNPISILIPCHRVVGSGGALTGYAGGVVRKQWLLRHEGARPDD